VLSFRSTDEDIEKLKFSNEILSKCGEVNADNQSEALRWLITFNFDLLTNIIKKKGDGVTGTVFSVDFPFLKNIVG